MRKLGITLLTLALSGSAIAQTPWWHWGRGFANGSPSDPFGDATGHTFFQYHFNDTAEINGQAYSEVNGLGILFATLDANGNYVDVQQLAFDPGTLSEDGPGTFHFERWFADSLVLPDSVWHTPGRRSLAYGQMDGAGTISAIELIASVPIEEYTDPLYIEPASMLLRASGNVAVFATVPDSIRFGDTVFHVDTASLFVAEFTPTGTLLWTTAIAKGEALKRGGLDEDLAGDLYVSGACGTCLVADSLLPGEDIWDTNFAAKLDAGGQSRLLWAGTYKIDVPTLLAGSADRFYLGMVNSNNNSSEAYTMALCLDTAGTQLWSNIIAGPTEVWPPALQYDADRHVLADAYYVGSNPDHRFRCLDSTGTVQWTKDIDQGGNLFGATIYPDSYGCYFVTGAYEFNVILDQISILDHGSNQRGTFIANLCGQSLGIDEGTPTDSRPRAWPDPVGRLLHLSVPTGREILIRMLDLQGRAVLQPFTLRSSAVVDVSSLSSGMYIIATVNGTTRFIKE